MAMNAGDETIAPGTLSRAIYDGLEAEYGSLAGDPTSEAKRKQFCKVIAQAVVAHITANAEVAVSVTSVSGVTAGAGVSGPGTGTGTIA